MWLRDVLCEWQDYAVLARFFSIFPDAPTGLWSIILSPPRLVLSHTTLHSLSIKAIFPNLGNQFYSISDAFALSELLCVLYPFSLK